MSTDTEWKEKPLYERAALQSMVNSFRVHFAEALEDFLTDPKNNDYYDNATATFPKRIREGLAIPRTEWLNGILCRVAQDLRRSIQEINLLRKDIFFISSM